MASIEFARTSSGRFKILATIRPRELVQVRRIVGQLLGLDGAPASEADPSDQYRRTAVLMPVVTADDPCDQYRRSAVLIPPLITIDDRPDLWRVI